MNEIAKRYATDEVFREVANLLYGDGMEISKANPDGADLNAKKAKSERRQTRIAQVSNAVGLAAGAAGTGAALRDDRFKEGGKVARKLYKVGQKIPSPISGKGGKAGAALAGGALGLQFGNIAGDVVTSAVLSRSAKKQNVKKNDISLTKAKLVAVGAGSSGLGAGVTQGYLQTKNKKKVKKSLRSPRPGSLRAIKRDVAQTAANARVASAHDVRASRDKAKAARTVRRSAGAVATAGVGGAAVGGYTGGGALRRKADARFPAGTKNDQFGKSFDVTWEGEISKVNADKQQVFGWASIVEINGEPVVDLQGDYISIEEVEKSAYEYVHKSRKGGDMHLRDGEKPVHASDMIESMVITDEKKKALGMPEDSPTGWWVGYQVNDPVVWAKVKSGERTGFSIHGRGVRS